MDALFFLAVILLLLTGAFTVRRILRAETGPVLKIVLVCATVLVTLFAVWVCFIVFYYATGGH